MKVYILPDFIAVEPQSTECVPQTRRHTSVSSVSQNESGGKRAAVQTLREVPTRWVVAIAFGVSRSRSLHSSPGECQPRSGLRKFAVRQHRVWVKVVPSRSRV